MSVPEVRYAGPAPDFAKSAAALGVRVHRATDRPDVREAVLSAIGGRRPVVLADHRSLADLDLPGTRWPMASAALRADAAVGVTPVVAAVAVTGGVALDATLGRGVSLLPPVVVFVVRTDQIVATPGDVLRHRDRFWPAGLPSQVLFVTGPSRSADIEFTLVPGVHGPGEVHVVLVDSSGSGERNTSG